MASAAPAAAQVQTVYAVGQGSPNQAVLTIPVTASVGGRCGFSEAPSGSFHQNDIDVNSWTHDFAFKLDCNGPSRVAVVSANGGLLNPTGVVAGYFNKAPYQISLNLVPDAGAPVTGSCQAADLVTGGSCSFLGPASMTQGLRLASASTNQNGSYLRVSAPAYPGPGTLVAGGYADTLTVTLSVSP